MINLTSFVRNHAIGTPERPALSFAGVVMSYERLHQSTLYVAQALTEVGVGPGSVIALLMKNSVAFIQFALAASHIGAIFLPLNFRLSADEISYIVNDSEARVVVVDEELARVVPAGIDKLIVSIDAQRDASGLSSEPASAEPYPCVPGDLFRLMYTSGTTDRPKGVMHSYENFYWKSVDHLLALELNSETRLLVVGPLYHVGAFDLPGIAVLWAGGMLSIRREFDPAATLAAIADERLNSAWLPPVMTSALLACETASTLDLKCLKWIVGGGERTPEARVLEFSQVFSEARYIDAYGLTETCSGDTLMPRGYELLKIGSCGRALMHVAITVRDEDGISLSVGQEGEICVRGPKVTKGYWKDPVKTEAAFFGDWFRTGDVGYLDDDGFLFITDRKKDMIISGGENIASLEVERALQMLPEILEVAVIGLPDARWGERPVAVIVTSPGAVIDFDRLRTHCRAQLAGFKVPQEFILRTELPRNPSGKILKRELRAQLLG